MILLKKLAFLTMLCNFCYLSPVNANIIVTWEDNADDLVIRWDGDISNWSFTRQDSYNFNVLQTNNGMHALDGLVDVTWTGTTHNWYDGPSIAANLGIMAGDSFGTSGIHNWVYMPGNYAGESISGSLTYTGFGEYVGLGYFNAGSRDLGFGDNDNIIFQAYEAASVAEPSTLILMSLGLLGLLGASRKKLYS